MARTKAKMPEGGRITDYISLGVIHQTFPLELIRNILDQTGRVSRRQRDLPAHVMVYYVIAMVLFMPLCCREVLRCLLEGLRWLAGPVHTVRIAGRSAIAQARDRLGWEPLRALYDGVVKPIATSLTRGACYRGWRIISLDGSTLDVQDTPANRKVFGRPGSSRGKSAFPKIRFVSLLENGTHVLFGSRMGRYSRSEASLAKEVLKHLKPGMLCLADRYFFSFRLWKMAQATGADLVWRIKKNLRFPCIKRFPDGSYLSCITPGQRDRGRKARGMLVRVIEYTLEGVPGAEPVYRLVTTILDWEKAPAQELAALYHERWEIEGALDELKTHLRGAQIVLRSRTPDLVRQEFYGMMLAHFAIRGLMHEAALKGETDADTLSFVHTVRVIRRKLTLFAAFSPSEHSSIPSIRAQ
jgi:hypothetical protein